MTLQEIHSVFKSRPFKLTNHKGESCKLIFTEIYVIREEKIIAEYEIREVGNGFNISFQNVQNGDLANDKNISFVSDSYKTILNLDGLVLQRTGRVNCFLIGV